MSDYKQVEETVDIPLDTGVDGFLLAIRQILLLSRVIELHINSKGKVTYKRWVRDEDEANTNLRLDFESVTPIGVIRNNNIIDVGVVDAKVSPAVAVCRLLHRIQADHMYPAVLVVGANSVFFDWFRGCGIDIQKNAERFFGHQLMRDRFVEDDVLLVCTSFGSSGSLIDTRTTYKLLLPPREAPVRFLPGAIDEDRGSDGQGRIDQPGDVIGVPEVGSPSSRSGRAATIHIPDLSRGGGSGH
jgi:hypothetical protein